MRGNFITNCKSIDQRTIFIDNSTSSYKDDLFFGRAKVQL